MVSCNLAISWAMGGASVCLVEADMRRPQVAAYLGVEGALGLSDVLVGEARLADVLISWNHGMITALPSGSLPPDPAALLESAAMHSLVAELSERFDIVIYDTPPLLAVTDALVLADHIDGAILMVRSGKTSREQLAMSLDVLSNANMRTLGTVLTFATAKDGPLGYESDLRSGPPSSAATAFPRTTQTHQTFGEDRGEGGRDASANGVHGQLGAGRSPRS